jgi:hypothetical protein
MTESVIAINKGGGQFEIKVLPKEVQSPLWMPFCDGYQ